MTPLVTIELTLDQLYLQREQQHHKWVKNKRDPYNECTKHGTKWWPGQFGPYPCNACFAECVHEIQIRGWEKRRGQHFIHSDLPFTEPKP